jgi:hypothetical protein
VINFCEFLALRFYKLAIAMLISIICMSLMLIFCRGHYSIDIFGGVLFGHYFWIQGEKWAWVIDHLIMKIPFYKRYPYF